MLVNLVPMVELAASIQIAMKTMCVTVHVDLMVKAVKVGVLACR